MAAISVLDDEALETKKICVMHPTPSVRYHEPALVSEVLEFLNPRPGAVIVDGTCGTGGHGQKILPRLLPDGRLIAIDCDNEVLELARRRLTEFESQVSFVHDNFRNLDAILKKLNVNRVDGLLLDLGVSSLQLDLPERGFSFLREGPLDMRMDSQQAMSAEKLVNALPAAELARLLQALGEERFAMRIAQRIVRERKIQSIKTTTQLAQIIVRAVPPAARRGRLHLATRTFQALRIAVNDELESLKEVLECLPSLLAVNGRALILSFHSLEDRLVKHAFLNGAREGHWKILTKKPVRPSRIESSRNSRVRSVKLRAVEKII